MAAGGKKQKTKTEKERENEMKIFHLSDLHIGLKLIRRDLREEQEYILGEVVRMAATEKPDAVIIAGDIYDKAIPSAEAVEVFDNFVSAMTDELPETTLMMISGNHDSAARLNVFRSILGRQRVHMIGMPPRLPEEYIAKVVLTDAYGEVNFYLLPFVKPSAVRQIVAAEEEDTLSYDETLRRLIGRENIDAKARNVIVSHQFYLPTGEKADEVERMDSEIRTVGNIDEVKADILSRFDYAALGHIHKPMKVAGECCRYSGTPICCSVSEAGQEKGIVVAELGAKGEVATRVLPLVPRRRVRVISGKLGDVLAAPSDDYVKVVLTDEVDLDVIDMQDRLNSAFPNLLEIERKVNRATNYNAITEPGKNLDPYSLCCDFLSDLDEEEKTLLQDVINTVKGVEA